MKKTLKFLLRAGVLLFAVAAVYLAAADLLMPKFMQDLWHATRTIDGFYEEEKGSLDFLFLGSSQTATSITPMEMYEKYGITGYNLSTEQQNLVLSYYLMKDALRYQKPKVVVLDTLFLFQFYSAKPVNMNEMAIRKVVDAMPWSSVKMEAIRDICELVPEEHSALSYYLTPIRYHERWKEIDRSDFYYYMMQKRNALKGYAVYDHVEPTDHYGFTLGTTDESAEFVDMMVTYFDKLAKLCKEEGIELLLIKTPRPGQYSWGEKRHNACEELAQEYGLTFIDFNTTDMLETLGWDSQQDSGDVSHVNMYGASKLTDYMGKYLMENYGLEDHRGEAAYSRWEEDLAEYREELQNYRITHCEDLEEYLEMINQEQYTVFLSVKKDASAGLTEKAVENMKKLGLGADLSTFRGCSYLAVKDGTVIHEEVSADSSLSWSGSVNTWTRYKVTSAGNNFGNSSSVILDDAEYSVNRAGLNIVVYDNHRNIVVDSVCFGTYQTDVDVKRRTMTIE